MVLGRTLYQLFVDLKCHDKQGLRRKRLSAEQIQFLWEFSRFFVADWRDGDAGGLPTRPGFSSAAALQLCQTLPSFYRAQTHASSLRQNTAARV
jgi:hypothetical protein